MKLTADQATRLEQIQQRRTRRSRPHSPAWASIEDVEEYVRITSDRPKRVYIYQVPEGYDWMIIDPATGYEHEGELVKAVDLEPDQEQTA